VIAVESHPNSHNQGPSYSQGTKEGFSMFGLFYGFARSNPGRLRLKQMFLRPTAQPEVINERLDTIAAFNLPSNAIHLQEISKKLKLMRNVKRQLRDLRKGSCSVRNASTPSWTIWQQLVEFTTMVLFIRDEFQIMENVNHLKIYELILSKIDGNALAIAGSSIAKVVDLDESKVQGVSMIQYGLEEDFDAMRRQYDGLGDLLKEVARYLRSTFPAELEEAASAFDVDYMPRIGFVIQVDEMEADSLQAHFADSENPWELVFVSGYVAFKMT
jgi:DNA mismatch repair protein MSH5